MPTLLLRVWLSCKISKQRNCRWHKVIFHRLNRLVQYPRETYLPNHFKSEVLLKLRPYLVIRRGNWFDPLLYYIFQLIQLDLPQIEFHLWKTPVSSNSMDKLDHFKKVRLKCQPFQILRIDSSLPYH